MPRPLAVSLLLLTTVLWGFAFVAQKSAMGTLGPLTFAAARYSIGTLAILPVVAGELRRARPQISRRDWGRIAILSVGFFLGVYLQQAGLTITTVTNAGFLTSLYVLFVPLIALAWMRRMPHPVVWVGVPLAILGVFLLNGGRIDRFNFGDLMVVGGAIGWAVQVLLIGELSKTTALPVTLSVLCFATTAVLSIIGAVAFEAPQFPALAADWGEIVYTGLLSTAVAFTLQAVAQQYVPPANAAIILSAESLFAALGGAVVLGERLPAIGYFGAALIFVSIVLVETAPILMERRARTQPV